jgi:tetratricopeptide (TPR) repeat protein
MPLLQATLAFMIAESDAERADGLIATARSAAMASQDVDALKRVLLFDAYFGDDVGPSARIAGATELLAMAGRSDSTILRIDLHSIRGAARMEAGDFDGAEVDFLAHARLAAELRTPGPLAVDDQRRAMRALLRGRFVEAEARVHEAMLHVSDDPAWVGVYGAQLIANRAEQGRWSEILALLDSVEEDAVRPVSQACRVVALAETGRRAEAAALLDELLAQLPGWRREMFWTIAVANLATASVLLEDLDAAALVYDVLAPYEDRVTILAFGAVCWGSVARFLAPLASLLGRRDAAIAHHERAVAVHERLGAVTFLARDRYGLAHALLDRGDPRDRARARRLGAQALSTANELGLTDLIEPARRLVAEGAS